ncbi:MAG TPA: ABA4-like family protein [Vicinamibacterales bacterium]|nr:ABA4-like family protein [Vicinamibacterales bacterium]
MYLSLFQIASLAIVGWIPLIFFPTSRLSRRLADSAFFPLYIAVLYAFGVGALLMESGPGFIADFGTAEGVARLLARQEIAWVAWLHILAFDQVIGLLIYRENMRRRYVPLPVQSALLFLTLMFGPLGYLAFAVIRVARLGPRAFGEDDDSAREPARRAASDTPPTIRQIVQTFREERGVTMTALAGIALGGIAFILAAVRGPLIPPEGDLMKPAAFDVAVGLFILSLIPWLSVSGFSEAGRRRWRGWMIGLLIYGFGVETIQQFRGIDPRFSQAEPGTSIFGGIFFATALGIMTLSVALAARAFEVRTEGRGGLLVVAARWASASMLMGFLAGFWLSANQGRFVGESGNLLPLHAAGFHAVQAVPLVALMLAWSAMPVGIARRWVHVAGAAWATACLVIWVQTALGRAVTDLASVAGAAAAALLGVWMLAALRALVAWRTAPAAGAFAGTASKL